MNRSLYLDSCPYRGLQRWAGQEFISPNRSMTRTLRLLSRRSSRTLADVAQQVLRDKDLGVAPVVVAHRLVREATGEVLETADPEGTARSLISTVRSLLQTGADLVALESTGSPRVRRLAQLARVYRAKLRSKGLVDKAELLMEADRLGPQPRAIMVYGYPWLVADELAFVDALAGEGRVLILPWADHPFFTENRDTAELLGKRGWQVIQDAAEPESPGEALSQKLLTATPIPGGIRAHTYPHLEAEIRGVLAQVKDLLAARISPGDIVLVTRDETLYGPAVLAVAWEYGLQVRARYNVSVLETRMGAWIQLLLEVILQRLPFEPTARLLSHPLGPGLSADKWRDARQRHPAGPEGWQAIGVDLADLVWPAKDSRSRWVDRLQGLLDRFKLRGQAGRVVRDIIAINKIQREGLPALAEPGGEP